MPSTLCMGIIRPGGSLAPLARVFHGRRASAAVAGRELGSGPTRPATSSILIGRTCRRGASAVPREVSPPSSPRSERSSPAIRGSNLRGAQVFAIGPWMRSSGPASSSVCGPMCESAARSAGTRARPNPACSFICRICCDTRWKSSGRCATYVNHCNTFMRCVRRRSHSGCEQTDGTTACSTRRRKTGLRSPGFAGPMCASMLRRSMLSVSGLISAATGRYPLS